MGALTVLYLVLPLPLAFILHDAEELAVQHKWMLTHSNVLCTRFPWAKSVIERLLRLNTGAFAIAAFEELVVLLIVIAYVLVRGPFATELWSAVFMVFSLHLIIHILQAVIVRSYVPGLITSVLLLPYSYLGIQSIWNAMSIPELILYTLLGMIIMIANLFFAHWLGIKICKRK